MSQPDGDALLRGLEFGCLGPWAMKEQVQVSILIAQGLFRGSGGEGSSPFVLFARVGSKVSTVAMFKRALPCPLPRITPKPTPVRTNLAIPKPAARTR